MNGGQIGARELGADVLMTGEATFMLLWFHSGWIFLPQPQDTSVGRRHGGFELAHVGEKGCGV